MADVVTISIHGTTGAPGVKASIWLLMIDRHHATLVEARGNRGETIVNRNVVRRIERIGTWHDEALELRLPEDLAQAILANGEGCAVLVQRDDMAEILGTSAFWFDAR